MKNNIFKILFVLLAGIFIFACNEKDEFDQPNVGDGRPVVRYVRPCDVEKSDSLLTSAFLGNRIALIGNNLASVREIYFNDQKAKLNPELVTNNAIIVDVPQGIPAVKEDIIRLYTSGDSCFYSFETKVPAPSVNTMDCEYADAGDIVYINGAYFVNDGASPLKAYFADDVEAEIVEYALGRIGVKVPTDAQPGPVTVESVYGTTESSFYFRDDRNIILSFNNGISPDYDYFHGWHGAKGVATDGGVNGNYLILSGDIDNAGGTADADYCFDKWTYNPVTDPDAVDATQLTQYVLKFEAKVQGDWSAAALQFVFTGADEVWCNWQQNSESQFDQWSGTHGGNETWKNSATYPRGLWMPWVGSGSYTTSSWVTITIPMTDFNKGATGESLNPNGARHWTGITLWVGKGGVEGTACSPTIWIDNVRVVEK
jgi:hypothetical protein